MIAHYLLYGTLSGWEFNDFNVYSYFIYVIIIRSLFLLFPGIPGNGFCDLGLAGWSSAIVSASAA